MDKVRQVSMLALVGILAMLAGGYFLLVSPKAKETKAVQQQVATQEAANRTLDGQNVMLAKQAKNLPAQQAALARIARQLPGNPALPSLIRSLSKIADDAGVSLISLAPEKPVLATVGTASTVTAAPRTVGAAGATDALAVIKITVKVEGEFSQMRMFFAGVEKLPRSFLVGEFSLVTEDATATKPGPTIVKGEVKGRVFMIVPTPPAPVVRPAVSTEK